MHTNGPPTQPNMSVEVSPYAMHISASYLILHLLLASFTANIHYTSYPEWTAQCCVSLIAKEVHLV